jgi:hypothetical protein
MRHVYDGGFVRQERHLCTVWCRSWLDPHKKEEPLEAALKVKQGEIRPFAEAVKLSESSRTGRPYILR